MKKSVLAIAIASLSISVGSLSGLQKNDVKAGESKTLQMCIADSYLNESNYEHWTRGQRATKDCAYWAIGIGISAICPVAGGIYGL